MCGGYRVDSAQLYKVPLYFAMYIALAGVVALVTSAFVTPTPSGKEASCVWQQAA